MNCVRARETVTDSGRTDSDNAFVRAYVYMLARETQKKIQIDAGRWIDRETQTKGEKQTNKEI